MNHVLDTEVTQLIEQYAREHQLPYRKHSLGHALWSHFELLRANARVENIFEETM